MNIGSDFVYCLMVRCSESFRFIETCVEGILFLTIIMTSPLGLDIFCLKHWKHHIENLHLHLGGFLGYIEHLFVASGGIVVAQGFSSLHCRFTLHYSIACITLIVSCPVWPLALLCLIKGPRYAETSWEYY